MAGVTVHLLALAVYLHFNFLMAALVTFFDGFDKFTHVLSHLSVVCWFSILLCMHPLVYITLCL